MGLYKHKITALAGIVNFLEINYPNSDVFKSIKSEKISHTHILTNYKGVNDLIIEFRKQRNGHPSKYIDRNSEYVQSHWYEFKKYLKENLK